MSDRLVSLNLLKRGLQHIHQISSIYHHLSHLQPTYAISDHRYHSTNEQTLDDEPFADVSFHSIQNKGQVIDPFSSMPGVTDGHGNLAHKTQSEPFDLFNSSVEISQEHGGSMKDVGDSMGSLSINGYDMLASENQNGNIIQKGSNSYNMTSSSILNGAFASPAAGMNANFTLTMGAAGYNFPAGVMFNPAIASHPMNYSAMGHLLAQHQFLSTMSNFQQLGNMHPNTTFHAAGSNVGNSNPFPDIFNPGMGSQPPTSLMNDTKREETKAFDFISDHLNAVRDPKRVI